ncbi:Nicotinamide-nucleotide adenylyltransferase, NadM family / ADP-ribose pyrophosphatase [hydrothermal vent metagenome]|uniref:Nicotinamide-nucleotide adenylyltransferase, NadM family / ADP-ribose pyrophosphatase n=1 Tax=hydrothermal vent metagenome TaxID=652676 RepID=A0A3B0Y4P4_9ZZZZ
MDYCYPYPHPAVTTDMVIFTIRDSQLSVLLIQRRDNPFKGLWALPGGFVHEDEDVDQCARRELEEETGLKDIYLEQLYTFGKPDRDPRERVISVAYFALLPSSPLKIRAASDASDVTWHEVSSIPALGFDHNTIIKIALERLIAKLDYSTIAFQLLPDLFTLTEVQKVYEIILGQDIDKRNFRKQILALDNVKKTKQQRREGAHRPAFLYTLKKRDTIEWTR